METWYGTRTSRRILIFVGEGAEESNQLGTGIVKVELRGQTEGNGSAITGVSKN